MIMRSKFGLCGFFVMEALQALGILVVKTCNKSYSESPDPYIFVKFHFCEHSLHFFVGIIGELC